MPNDDTADTSDLVPGDILMDLGTGVRLIYKDFGSTQGDDHTLIRMDGKNATQLKLIPQTVVLWLTLKCVLTGF